MSAWAWAIAVYLVLAGGTFAPVLIVFLSKIKLNDGGPSFDQSGFSDDARKKLTQHYLRMQGTLAFWKKQATWYRRFHYYNVGWSITSATIMPFLTQAIDGNDSLSKWLLTVIAAHIALLLAFHRGLKVAEHFKAFRHGESEFYDTYRRLLDRPETFGRDEAAQIAKYFDEVQQIRKFVRNAETDSLPNVEDVREKMTRARR